MPYLNALEVCSRRRYTNPRLPLPSSDTLTCVLQCTLTHIGDRLFTVAGPNVWNTFTATLHLVDNFLRHTDTLTCLYVLNVC